MKDRWNYTGLGQVVYGHDASYAKPAAWFDELGGTLEDWGCGCAVMRKYVQKCKYIGIEGSANAYADRCDVDLREFVSKPDHILMRDVLDHNVDWKLVLQNAVNSFQKRMVLITFMEMQPKTHTVFVNTDKRYPGVPDIVFRAGDLVKFFVDYLVRIDRLENETIFYLEK